MSPTNITTGQESDLFPGQLEDEKTLIFIRRHWISFLLWIVILIVMSVLPLLFLIGAFYFDRIGDIHGETLVISSATVAMYLMFINALFLTAWIEHYLDVSIITTDRLLNIQQVGLFNRRVSELSMLRVQDVSAQMRGYLQTFFQFGTVVVETAGEAPNFVMHNVPRPHVVANTILAIHDRLIHSAAGARETRRELTGMKVENPVLPSVAHQIASSDPPADYDHDHFSEDLLTQTNEAKGVLSTQEPEQAEIRPAVVRPKPPENRLPPPSFRDTDTPSREGDLEEGKLITFDKE